MSISIVLVPIAIALFATADQIVMSKRARSVTKLKTRFNDADLLEDTLQEYGLKVARKNDNNIVGTSGGYALEYKRRNEQEAFQVDISNIRDREALLSELRDIDEEYNRNVQAYTYTKLLDNLKESQMEVENERVMEDNSILLTINV